MKNKKMIIKFYYKSVTNMKFKLNSIIMNKIYKKINIKPIKMN